MKVQSFDKAPDTPKKVQNHCQHEQTKERQSSHLSHHKTYIHHKERALWKAPSVVSQKKKECNLLSLVVQKIEYKAE